MHIRRRNRVDRRTQDSVRLGQEHTGRQVAFSNVRKVRRPAQLGVTINLRNDVLLVGGRSNVDILWGDRFEEQRSRMMESGQRFFFIVEGDLRDAGRLYGNALSLTIKQHIRGIPLIRTWDIQETFASLIMLIEKMENPPGILVQSGIRLPPRSKRAREASPQTCFARMLRCVPGCWDSVATALAEEFKTLPALQKAISSDRIPRLELANGKFLGKARWKRLRAYLLDDVTVSSPANPNKIAHT